MAKKALGMIEVKGMLGSVVAADIALKTAEVHLIDKYTIKGGWTSVEFFGDIGAIKEAINAAREAIQPMECFKSSNVIANLDPQVEEMIMKSIQMKKRADKQETSNETVESGKTEETVRIKQETKESNETEPTKHAFTKAELKKKFNEFLSSIDKKEIKALEELKVVELRSFAYLIELSSLTKKEIKFANKSTLLDHLRKEGVE